MLADERQRIGQQVHGDGEASITSLFEGHEVVAEHEVHRDFLEEIVVELEIVQIDEFATIAAANLTY